MNNECPIFQAFTNFAFFCHKQSKSFRFQERSIKILWNPFVLEKSRTHFQMNEMSLETQGKGHLEHALTGNSIFLPLNISKSDVSGSKITDMVIVIQVLKVKVVKVR